MISKTRAAIPNPTGTKITSHVGLSTQFDYTSQNYVPKNDLQQPPRQKFGSAHPFVYTIFFNKFFLWYFDRTLLSKIIFLQN